MISEKTLKTLEYPKILKTLAVFVRGKSTAEECMQNTRPAESFQEMELLQEQTRQADKALYTFLINPISDYEDVRKLIGKAQVQSILSIPELLCFAQFLRAVRICKQELLSIEDKDAIGLLCQFAEQLSIDKRLEDDIENAVEDEQRLSDNASFALKSIRREIMRCNNEIKSTIQGFLKGGMQKYLQDTIITVRDGRFVVPVKAEYRQNVPGIVHDRSQTGATLYIEPMQAVELNNKLRTLEIDERNEIERILKDFSLRIGESAEQESMSYDSLCRLDLIFARASMAKTMRAVPPEINSSGHVEIKRARHPLIATESVVPIDIRIGTDFDALIITGPNTGGKTVSLKTVGLFSLLAMSGMFIPAEYGSQLSFFRGIYCDIGDEQSIENSLSTFSSHILNIKEICEKAGRGDLVLLDEVGAGTDPEEGAALAESIISCLVKKGAKLMTTTHYGKLKEFSAIRARVKNASMEFDPESLKPTYRLMIGSSGSSKAFEIAKSLGLSDDIIEEARRCLTPQKLAFDQITQEAERTVSEYNRLLKQLSEEKIAIENEKQKLETDRIRLNAQMERKETIAFNDYKRKLTEKLQEADETVLELKRMLKSSDVGTADIVKAGKLKGRIEEAESASRSHGNVSNSVDMPDTYPIAETELTQGKEVYLKSLSQRAIIVSSKISKGKVSVQIGSIQMQADLNDILGVRQTKKKQKTVGAAIIRAPQVVKSEINLLGQTVFDAEIAVDSFLDAAAGAGLKEVRIIHGIGTGKLRTAVRDLLKKNALVAEFRSGTFGEGEGGVTIVTLK